MSNKRWNPLPPISRTPSPPPEVLHRLQSYGGGVLAAVSEGPDDPEWDDERSSTPAAAGVEPPRKKRKTRKGDLLPHEDPARKWDRWEGRDARRAMGKGEEDEDMLDSINVTGGYLMIGERGGNPRIPSLEKETGKKKGWQKTSTPKSRAKGKGKGTEKTTPGSKGKGRAGPSKLEVPSLESRITYPDYTTLEEDGTLKVSKFGQENDGNTQIPKVSLGRPPQLLGDDTAMPDLSYDIPSSIPSSDSGTATLPKDPTPKSGDPAPPESPLNPDTTTPAPLGPETPSVPPSVTWSTAPSSPPPNPHLYDLAKQLTFQIYAFPDLRRTWTISGQDLCSTSNNNFPTCTSSTSASPTATTSPPASPLAPESTGAGPSYTTLSLILTRKFSTPVTSSRILINYTFTISTQEDLDACILQLVHYARPIHDIVLVGTGDDPKAVINAMRSRDRDFWKGRKEDSQLPEAALVAVDTLAGGAESTSRRDRGTGGGKRASSGKGRGKERSRDGRVLSSEFVEPGDDYSEDEDMGMSIEAPDSMPPFPAERIPLQVVGKIVSGVKHERQKDRQIPPALTAPPGESLSKVEVENVTSTMSTCSPTQGVSTEKLTTPVPAVSLGIANPLRKQETGNKTEEAKTQTQFVGHVLSNERSNPSPAPAPASGSGKAMKRKLEGYPSPPLATSEPTRPTRGTLTAAFNASQCPVSRWRSGVVEVGTQTGTPTRGVGNTITVAGSDTKEHKWKRRSRSLTAPSTSPSKADVPPEAAEERQETPQKALGERMGESSGNISALVAVQKMNKIPTSPENLQIPVAMPLVISEKGSYDPALLIEGPDNSEGAAPVEVIGAMHEAIQSEGVPEKEQMQGQSGGEGQARTTEQEMVGAAVNPRLEDSGLLNNAEGVNKDERPGDDEPGKESEKEEGVQQLKVKEEIATKVSVSGMELIIVPTTSKEGGDPLAAFQVGAGAEKMATEVETETQEVPDPALPALPAAPTETGGILLSTGGTLWTAVEGSAPSSASALSSPSAEDEPLPARTPPQSPPPPSPRMQTPPSPVQTREELPKSFVAVVDTAANDSGLDGRAGNYQNATRSAIGPPKAVNEQGVGGSSLKENGKGIENEDVNLDREFVVHNGRFSVPPMLHAEESGSAYSPSEKDSVTNSTVTEVAEQDAPLQWRDDDVNQRREGATEAAATPSALEAPSFLKCQPGNEARSVREDGQSVDIMRGADLLLWAAGAVDADFVQHVPPTQLQIPPRQSMQQQYEVARASVAAAADITLPLAMKKGKPRKRKEPKIPKETTKAKTTKAGAPKGSRKRSLIVTLKVPIIPNSVDEDSPTTGSLSSGVVTASGTPPPASPPNRRVPSLGFTSIGTLTPIVASPILKPQPFRKLEAAAPRLIATKPPMSKPKTSSMEAHAAAREQVELAKSAKFKGVGSIKSGSNNNPGQVGASAPITIEPASITPIPVPVPSTIVGPLGPSVNSQVQPASPDIDMNHPPTTNDASPLPPLEPSPVSPRVCLPAHPLTQKISATVNNSSNSSQNELLDRTSDSPLSGILMESPMGANESDQLAAGIMASLAAGERVIVPPKSPGTPTRQTTPFPLPQRATLTPEYIESKKVVPLVGKNNFLYWDPSMAKGAGGTDCKVQTGETVNTSISPIKDGPVSGPRPGSVAGLAVEGRSFYQSPPLRPLSDTVRSSTAPLPQSQPQLMPIPRQHLQSQVQPALSSKIPPQPLPRQQRPFTPPSVLPNPPLKPAEMVFNISRYERGDQKIIVYGRDILANSSETFSWVKLVKLLEVGIQYDDLRESLIVNFHHMVDDESALNEGLGWYRKDNEVLAAKVDSFGKPPKLLAERIKRERKALRERGVCRSPV